MRKVNSESESLPTTTFQSNNPVTTCWACTPSSQYRVHVIHVNPAIDIWHTVLLLLLLKLCGFLQCHQNGLMYEFYYRHQLIRKFSVVVEEALSVLKFTYTSLQADIQNSQIYQGNYAIWLPWDKLVPSYLEITIVRQGLLQTMKLQIRAVLYMAVIFICFAHLCSFTNHQFFRDWIDFVLHIYHRSLKSDQQNSEVCSTQIKSEITASFYELKNTKNFKILYIQAFHFEFIAILKKNFDKELNNKNFKHQHQML